MGKDNSYKLRKPPSQTRKKTDKDQLLTQALSLPDLIDHNACWIAYHLTEEKCTLHVPPNPKTQNCKNNPFCIHRLGLEKIEKLKAHKGGESPSTEVARRPAEQPCGLVNMGNYCYMNSFLQIWFNDLVFRQGIYDWRADLSFVKPETSKLDVQAVMNCMQELFIRMQITPFTTTDAKQLSDLLKLDNEQHDVQEFTILFFDAIDRNLVRHPNGQVFRDMIRRRFEGKMRQTIECACGRRSVSETPLRSIQIIIEGFKSLTKAIENSFKAENLADYKCDQCQQVGNVVKRIAPVELPPVLMIPLSRYIYDERGQSKKLRHPIQYPRILEERVLNPEAEQNREYELCAVMIHEGPNTYCGHYYDVIKDPVTNKWFTYNDKNVEEFKPAPGVTVEKENIGRGTSDMKGCYALIYRFTEPGDPQTIDDLRLPPATVVSRIEDELNDAFLKETTEGNHAHNLWLARLNERCNHLQALWKTLEVRNGKEAKKRAAQIAFLPTALLIEILEKEFKAIKETKEIKSTKNKRDKPTHVIPAQEDVEQAMRELEEEGQMKDQLDDDFIERLNEIVDRKNACEAAAKATVEPDEKEKEHLSDEELTKILYSIEPLKDATMRLCAHGKVSLDAVYKSEVKAVSAAGTEMLLRAYNLSVSLEESSESDDFNQESSSAKSTIRTEYVDDVREGKQWDVGPRETDLFSQELCAECVRLFKKEAEFKHRLEQTASKVLEPIIKTVKQRGYDPVKETAIPEWEPPEDGVWIAQSLLRSYRKLATQQLDFLKQTNRSSTQLKFSTSTPGLDKVVLSNGNKTPQLRAISSPSTRGSKRKKSESDADDVLEEFLEFQDEDKAKDSKNGATREEQLLPPATKRTLTTPRSSVRTRSECNNGGSPNGVGGTPKNGDLREWLSKAHGSKNRFASLSVAQEDVQEHTGDTDMRRVSESSDSSSVEVIQEKLNSSHVNDDQPGPSKNDEAGTDMDIVIEDGDDNRSSSGSMKEADADRPESGASNTKGAAQPVFFNKELQCEHGGLNCTVKRVWLKRKEWEELVNAFDEYNTVPINEPECQVCRQKHSHHVMERDDKRDKFTNIQQALGKLGRTVEKRLAANDELGTLYTNVVCSVFIQSLKQNTKVKDLELPSICQQCFICRHDQPYLTIPTCDDDKDVPGCPLPVTRDEWNQIVNVLQEHAPEQGKPYEIAIDQDGFGELFCMECYSEYKVNENSKRFIYPEGGYVYVRVQEDKGDESKDAAAERPTTSNVTTRRAKTKGMLRIHIASTATVKDLKLKLYGRTNQSPIDQLILMGNVALEDDQTLEDAKVSSNNSDSPLVLIVQQPTEITDEQRPIEKGFRDTALAI